MTGTVPAVPKKNRRVLQRMKKYWGFYLMFIPVLAFVIVFHYMPMFGIRYAFTQYKLIKAPVFVGLDQFRKLFGMNN